MRVPDLPNAYMVNTYDGFNRFQTLVECVLEREAKDGTKTRGYLSSRCRPEAVAPSFIFGEMIYSFGIFHTDQGTYSVYMGSSQCPRHPFRRRPAPAIKPFSERSVTYCGDVDARVVDFDSALADLQREGLDKNNQYFMKISWQCGEDRLSLYTPCGYINFPNPTRDQDRAWDDKPDYPRHELRYIQPIRGPVVYWDGKDYQLAFVAAHLTASGTQRLEFCLYDDLSFFQLKPGKGWRRTIQNLMAQSWIGRYFTMRDFHRIVPVEGECALYRYP